MLKITDPTCYTFLGVRGDGSVPVVDVIECATDAEAVARLEEWIVEHSTCVAAELWRGGVLVTVVSDPVSDRKTG